MTSVERTIQTTVQGYPTQDGAGVHLVRVLGNDPMLMMYDIEASVSPGEPQGGYLGVVLSLSAAVP